MTFAPWIFQKLLFQFQKPFIVRVWAYTSTYKLKDNLKKGAHFACNGNINLVFKRFVVFVELVNNFMKLITCWPQRWNFWFVYKAKILKSSFFPEKEVKSRWIFLKALVPNFSKKARCTLWNKIICFVTPIFFLWAEDLKEISETFCDESNGLYFVEYRIVPD